MIHTLIFTYTYMKYTYRYLQIIYKYIHICMFMSIDMYIQMQSIKYINFNLDFICEIHKIPFSPEKSCSIKYKVKKKKKNDKNKNSRNLSKFQCRM